MMEEISKERKTDPKDPCYQALYFPQADADDDESDNEDEPQAQVDEGKEAKEGA